MTPLNGHAVKAARLRSLLADRRWHLNTELNRKLGWRFGEAIERLRKGLDNGPALFIKTERVGVVLFRYRFEGINPHPPKRRTWKARALAAEAKLRELEGAK